jgi:hypothetical protein
MTLTITHVPATLADALALAERLENERQALLNTFGLDYDGIVRKRNRLHELSLEIDAAWGHVRRLKHGNKRRRGLV